ncbi:DUF4166 domain-containing protein [Haloarcula salina]|uniref:DUF4166 domain-containing protein n=1 Tax=Haloarcula salina TaxID=1429914 RepID=UPI003C6F4993
MTGVYERALGEAAADLHPKVRERYALDPDDGVVCVGRGEMDITRGTLVLPALYAMATQNMLFPESGRAVPFSVTTAAYTTAAGHEAMTTRRAFDFGDATRVFDSLTVWDADAERLLDFLGTRGRVATELHPRVEDGALVVVGGRQWARIGGRYVPLPGPLAADVEVRDRYDEADDRYHVTATVENALVGHVLGYRGTFTQEQTDRGETPADLRLVRDLDRLPPQ